MAGDDAKAMHLAFPKPLKLHVNWPKTEPPSNPAPDWSQQTAYQRDVAKWIVGGVLATVVGVLAGSSLTSFGALDFVETPVRLVLAIAGAVTGLTATGFFLHRALRILALEAGGINMLASADPEWKALAAKVNEVFEFELRAVEEDGNLVPRKVQDLIALRLEGTATPEDLAVLRKIRAMLGFLKVQHRFKQMVDILPKVGIGAIFGFGLFAWAANPPDPPAKPERGVTIKITQ